MSQGKAVPCSLRKDRFLHILWRLEAVELYQGGYAWDWGLGRVLPYLLLVGIYCSFCRILTYRWLEKYVYLHVRPEYSGQRDHRDDKHTLEILGPHFLVLSDKEGCEKAHPFTQTF